MYAGNQESLGHASHERKWLQEDQVRLQRNPEIKGRVCVCVCVWEGGKRIRSKIKCQSNSE